MPPAPSTTESPELKVLPAYKIRTMAGDLEAAKNRTQPAAIPITIEPPKEPEKKESAKEEKKLILEESKKISAIKPSFPKISFKKYGDSEKAGKKEEKTGFFGLFKKKEKVEITPDESPKIRIWPSPVPIKGEIKPSDKPLIPPRPLMPLKPQPFSSPINRPIIPSQQKMEPQQQTTYSPPPTGLPTMPVPPQAPQMRPLTPPPPMRPMPERMTRPPAPPIPQMQKLPQIPQRVNIPPAQISGLPPMEQMKPKKGKKMIAIVAISAVILTFIAGEIWWFFLRETPPAVPQTSEVLPPPQAVQPLLPEGAAEPITPVQTAPELPSSILSYSRTETIGAESLSDLSGIVSADEFVRFVVQSPAQTAGETSVETPESANPYADISAVAKMLKLKIPVSVSREFSGDFDVFAFGGNSFDQDECAKAKKTAASCSGPRLGLALKVSDPAKIRSAVRIWEKTMVSDLKSLILSTIGGSATANFQTGTYEGKTIRYKNMPINTITVEYALSDDILIITTSKSAIFKAIDSLPAKSIQESAPETEPAQ